MLSAFLTLILQENASHYFPLHLLFLIVLSQVHRGPHGPGQDLLEPGELPDGGETFPKVSGGLQRGRHLEAQRGSCPLHAEQVQGGHRLLRANRQEALRQRECFNMAGDISEEN